MEFRHPMIRRALPPLDSDVVFGDLTHAYQELEAERTSPVAVRRLFTRFVTLSQQLTDVMRVEFKRLTGGEWEARYFNGWNQTSRLFKTLRNLDLHAAPLKIDVKRMWCFPVSQFNSEAHPRQHLYLAEAQGSEQAGPFDSAISDEFNMWFTPDYGPRKGETIKLQHAACELTFILVPPNQAVAAAVRHARSDDLHLLARRYFATLTFYKRFYDQNLASG